MGKDWWKASAEGVPDLKTEVPGPESPNIIAGYTGFNSVNLQAFYSCKTFPARRSQIARGHGKPVIQRLPNGDLLATQWEDRPREVEAALCVSHDEGLTWSEPRLLGLPDRPSQLSVLSDGVVILAAGTRLYHSEDLGQTFQECPVPWDDFSRDKRPDTAHGYGETNGVLELPDGTLLCVCYTSNHPILRYDDWNGYVIRSTDRGKTWGDVTFLVNTDEVELLRLPDGKILGFARLDTSYTRDVWGKGDATGEEQIGEGGDTMALMESTDDGRTWTDPVPIGLGPAQVPGFPVHMPDGRIVLVYGNRQFPFGVQAVASRDSGKTWDLDNFLMLAWAGWSNFGGHPRSFLMPDRSIISGYYAHYFKDHQGALRGGNTVSHCLRWTPPADWPPA